MVFPRPEWEKFRERIAALPMAAQWWKRIFWAMPWTWRWTAPAVCRGLARVARSAAGIDTDIMLLGMGNHFELWEKATYEAQEGRRRCKAGMPDVFKDFSF